MRSPLHSERRHYIAWLSFRPGVRLFVRLFVRSFVRRWVIFNFLSRSQRLIKKKVCHHNVSTPTMGDLDLFLNGTDADKCRFVLFVSLSYPYN